MKINVQLHTPIQDSFRVRQIMGMFDLPETFHLRQRFSTNVPGPDEDWAIGMIVGPSGSGKTTIAKAAFGDALYVPRPWPTGTAVIDCLGDLPIHQLTQTLTAVGFASPRSWLKPFAVLSNGEKFRCETARAFLSGTGGPPVSDAPAPSPLYSGERAGVRGDFSSDAPFKIDPLPCKQGRGQGEGRIVELRGASEGPSPQPSPPFTREREPGPHGTIVAIDEFTSVVDRTVARIGSAAISRAIRSNKINVRFVAITCHEDVIPWLSPDWVLDMAGNRLAWGRVRRPDLQLDIRPATADHWPLFQPHHYLSGNIHRAARCFVGWFEGRPAAFTAVLPFPHPRRPGWREHRTVCLPDYQGVGIGSAMSDFVAGVFASTGKPYFSASGHPAMLAHRTRSPWWQLRRKPGLASPAGKNGGEKTGMRSGMSRTRITAGFEYVGPGRIYEAQELGLPVA